MSPYILYIKGEEKIGDDSDGTEKMIARRSLIGMTAVYQRECVVWSLL
jgi:hypothetical protein